MESKDILPSLQDFSLIKTNVEKIKSDLNLETLTNAFYFFVIDLILSLQEDEIKDSITDTSYLTTMVKITGHDRGIDAVYIDESGIKPKIHFFNFKYAMEFKNTKSNYPSSEIDKIISFISSLMQKDPKLLDDVNPVLASKVKEIWSIFDYENPNFIFHICSNKYYPFEKKEKDRFEREIHKNSNFEIKYHLMYDIVKSFTKKGKKIVNAKFRAMNRYLFEKSDGDIRALILDMDTRDLIRMVLDDDEIRNKVDIENYNDMKNFVILEDAFEDNVRVYLKQRSKINRNIKNTALSGDNHRFFYYNNGITITCEHFEYPASVRSPIVELKDLQIVNGGQTVHALFEAFVEDPSKFENMEILCRLYETRNKKLSTNIAEYTNSQNPVKSRDIRSIDYVQQKLEKELLALGYYYERKRNQYSDKPKNKRIDAEKVGQVLMAFYNKMPSEAKNKKSLIFAEKYDDVFNDSITADSILLTYNLFNKIETKKNEVRQQLLTGTKEYFDNNIFIIYSSYYILYIMGKLSLILDIELVNKNLTDIWNLYEISKETVKSLVGRERQRMEVLKEEFNPASFFKSNRPKKYFEDLLETDEIDKLLKKYKEHLDSTKDLENKIDSE